MRAVFRICLNSGSRSVFARISGRLCWAILSFAKTSTGGKSLICRRQSGENLGSMITLLLHLLRLLPFLFGGQRQLAVENLALRQQLAVYKRTTARPKLRTTDRLFWIWLARVWAGWRQPLVIVTADTVLRWQRRRFREHWTQLSGRPTGGRPPVNAEINHRPGQENGRGESPVGCPQNPWRAPEARHRRGRAHRLPADAEAPHTALADLAYIPDQSPPGPGRPRFLHGSHNAPARALHPGRSRPPSPTCPSLQRDGTSHRRLDRPAGRGRLPG